jgi:hypothetical protein
MIKKLHDCRNSQYEKETFIKYINIYRIMIQLNEVR